MGFLVIEMLKIKNKKQKLKTKKDKKLPMRKMGEMELADKKGKIKNKQQKTKVKEKEKLYFTPYFQI